MLQPPREVHCSEVGFSGELVGRMVEGEESRERRRVSSGVLFGCTVLGLGGRVALTSGSFPLAAQAENEGCVVPISLPEPGLVEDGPAAVWLSQPEAVFLLLAVTCRRSLLPLVTCRSSVLI